LVFLSAKSLSWNLGYLTGQPEFKKLGSMLM